MVQFKSKSGLKASFKNMYSPTTGSLDLLNQACLCKHNRHAFCLLTNVSSDLTGFYFLVFSQDLLE